MISKKEENFFNEFERSAKNTDEKEFIFFNEDYTSLVTIKFVINEEKLDKFKQFLNETYSKEEIETRKDIELSVDDRNEYYEDYGPLKYTTVDNIRTVTTTEKEGLFKTRKTVTRYGDVSSHYIYGPDFLNIIRVIENKKYFNLVNIYNYIVAVRGLDSKARLHIYESTTKGSMYLNSELRFNLNAKEQEMTNEEIIVILEKLFSCFKVIKREELSISDNKISIDINSSYEELMALKSKISLATINSEIINSNIIDADLKDVKRKFYKK